MAENRPHYRVETKSSVGFLVSRVLRTDAGTTVSAVASYWRREIADEVADSLNRWAGSEV